MTWTPQKLPADHPPVASGKVGVLVVNLGTPDAPDAKSVKRYLAEFLSDRRVVEIPALANAQHSLTGQRNYRLPLSP